MILHIDHIGLAARSFDEASELFLETLGFSLDLDRTPMPNGLFMAQENAWIYFIKVGTGPTQIELLLPQDTTTGMGRWLDKHGPSVHHLAYMVDNVAEHARELEGKGLARIDLGPNADAAFFYPRTTMGILTELVDARTVNRLHSGASSPTTIGPAEAAAALADFRTSRDLARQRAEAQEQAEAQQAEHDHDHDHVNDHDHDHDGARPEEGVRQSPAPHTHPHPHGHPGSS
jgi:methylmalonyl-CoA/ethylmalonyl-CoA epimerase